MDKIYRRIPSDLLIVLTWTMATFIFIVVPTLQNSIIRTILGLPLVLFIPGYVPHAVLFSREVSGNPERMRARPSRNA